MPQIVTIHSYRGGTGKSNITANLAYLAGCQGRRVAVLDTDLASPGVHVVFGLEKQRLAHTLSDFLFGQCELEEAAYDVSPSLDLGDAGGRVYLIPSSMTVEAITRIVSDGYDAARLNSQFAELMTALDLDVLFLDTHPGLNRETMLTTAISDTLVIIVRPDNQDFYGTALLTEVAGRLAVPSVFLVANKVPRRIDPQSVRQKLEEAFKYDVIGALPLTEEMVILGSRGLFTKEHPSDPMSVELGRILERVLASAPEAAT